MASVVMYSLFMGNRMVVKFAPLVDAALEIKLEATSAHLWFEEVITGDSHESIDQAWNHLDRSIWYTRAMLEGGSNEDGELVALRDPRLKRALERVLNEQKKFREIGEKRYALRLEGQAGVGSAIDQRFDDVFEGFVAIADEVENRLQQLVRMELYRFRATQVILIAIIAVLTVFMGTILHLFIRRRTLDHLALEQREVQLVRANKELARSNADLDDFAHTVSHDIKEPLRGIRNYSGILLEDYGDALDETGRSRLHTLSRLSERLQNFTDSLLRFSRVGKRSMVVQEVDLNDVVTGVVDSLRPLLERRRVDVRVPEPLPRISCDKDRMAEVFQNLITNSIKYNDKPDGWVEVGCNGSRFDDDYLRNTGGLDDETPYAILYVRDNGIGIPERFHEDVFMMFKRLHGRDRFGGGSGAGLTIVRKIVDRHRGRVWLDSRPGDGTTVYVAMPLST